jgi:hypothetical protein
MYGGAACGSLVFTVLAWDDFYGMLQPLVLVGAARLLSNI